MRRIVPGDFTDQRVIALIDTHFNLARDHSGGPESFHALDLASLQTPDVTFWCVWDDDSLAGMGALKRLSATHGEVKAMHTAKTNRRDGVGSAVLNHIVAVARAERLSRLSLETGSANFFAPARALYRRHGFAECGPFGDYVPDPNSVFMTLDLKSS